MSDNELYKAFCDDYGIPESMRGSDEKYIRAMGAFQQYAFKNSVDELVSTVKKTTLNWFDLLFGVKK